MRRRIVILTIIAMLAGVARASEPKIFASVDHSGMEAWVDSVMSSLTLDAKIAQLMVVEVVQSDSKSNLAALKEQVETLGVGGMLFMKGDIATQAKLTNYAQDLAAVPLFVAADAEWGLSMRLSDAPDYPTNMTLGAISDDRRLYAYGREMARQMRALGVNVNFGPVLDVIEGESNKAIGNRSFGESPGRTAALGVAFSKGLEDNGVLSVAKHFPGHGSASGDSHTTLPTVNKTLTGLELCELVPFRAYVKAGLGGIMTGHLSVPSIDNSGRATSMSTVCVTDLLRDKLGFEGLVFTDALEMQGASVSGSQCVAALLAGNDVLLSPRDVKREIAAVKAAISEGILTQAAIDEHCAKILRYKYALGLIDLQPIDEKAVASTINSEQSRTLLRKLFAGAATVLKNGDGELPLTRLERKRIAVVTLGASGDTCNIFQQRCAMYSQTRQFGYREGQSTSAIISKLKDYDVVILAALEDRSSIRAAMMQMAAAHPDVVSVICAKPYGVKNYRQIIKDSQAAVLCYDTCSIALDYAAQTIYGGNPAGGMLPVTVQGVASYGTGAKYKATRLGYTTPAAVGIGSSMEHNIDSIAALCIKKKAFPGCQVLVAHCGQVVLNKAYGTTDWKTKTPVTLNTIYDLASVSKALGTLPGIMRAYDQGLLEIDTPVSEYIAELRGGDKKDITLRQLLYHESGMPATLDMYKVMIDPQSFTGALFRNRLTSTHNIKVADGMYGNKQARLRTDITSKTQSEDFSIGIGKNLWCNRAAYDTIMSRIYSIGLRSKKTYLYSCLNFCLLMNAEERVTGVPHNIYVEGNFFKPLGAYHTTYRPTESFALSQIAPTEYDAMLRRQTVHGYVHDEMADFSGGVQGNAGLFSNANDLAKLCQMWLNGGVYGGDRYLKESTVGLFCTDKSKNSRRGLGFDKPDKTDDDKSPTCAEAPASAYGHLGFTGTTFWVDPDNDLIFIMLCNRVHPSRDNKAFSEINPRPEMFSAVYNALNGL